MTYLNTLDTSGLKIPVILLEKCPWLGLRLAIWPNETIYGHNFEYDMLWDMFPPAISLRMFNSKNNSMVWDIFSQTGEESGRSGNWDFISSNTSISGLRQAQQAIYAFHFSLETEIWNILRLGVYEEGIMGLSIYVLRQHTQAVGSRNWKHSVTDLCYSC